MTRAVMVKAVRYKYMATSPSGRIFVHVSRSRLRHRPNQTRTTDVILRTKRPLRIPIAFHVLGEAPTGVGFCACIHATPRYALQIVSVLGFAGIDSLSWVEKRSVSDVVRESGSSMRYRSHDGLTATYLRKTRVGVACFPLERGDWTRG